MTDAQKNAHLRMLEQLRANTRTHSCESSTQRRGIRFSKHQKAGLLERLKRMEAAGMSRKQMVIECHTSSKTIVRLLGKVRFI